MTFSRDIFSILNDSQVIGLNRSVVSIVLIEGSNEDKFLLCIESLEKGYLRKLHYFELEDHSINDEHIEGYFNIQEWVNRELNQHRYYYRSYCIDSQIADNIKTSAQNMTDKNNKGQSLSFFNQNLMEKFSDFDWIVAVMKPYLNTKEIEVYQNLINFKCYAELNESKLSCLIV